MCYIVNTLYYIILYYIILYYIKVSGPVLQRRGRTGPVSPESSSDEGGFRCRLRTTGSGLGDGQGSSVRRRLRPLSFFSLGALLRTTSFSLRARLRSWSFLAFLSFLPFLTPLSALSLRTRGAGATSRVGCAAAGWAEADAAGPASNACLCPINRLSQNPCIDIFSKNISIF